MGASKCEADRQRAGDNPDISWYDISVSAVQTFSQTDYRLLAEFRFQIHRFLHFSQEQARAHGLEPRQHQLLLAVAGLPEGTRPVIGELAARLFIRHHSAVELVDRLCARGLLRRTHGETDHREVLVSLTRAGETVLHRLSRAHREELDKLGPELAASLEAILRANP
jgi:DNA-binding MarR family transcriptional regulator